MDKKPKLLSLDIELTNVCKNNCKICPREAITRPKGFMDISCFNALIKFLRGYKPIITFSGMGDPLLNKRWPEYVMLAKSKGLNVGLQVHPSSLKREGVLFQLKQACPNRLYISFPGLTKHSFEYLNPSISFHEAIDIIKATSKMAKHSFGIMVSGVATKLDVDNAYKFQTFWKNKNIRAKVFSCHSRGGHLQNKKLILKPYKGEEDFNSCDLFLFHSFVTWNGSFLACCHDLDGSTSLGNIKNLTSQKLLNFKTKIMGNMPYDLCKKCDEPLKSIKVAWGDELTSIESRKKLFQSVQTNFNK